MLNFQQSLTFLNRAVFMLAVTALYGCGNDNSGTVVVDDLLPPVSDDCTDSGYCMVWQDEFDGLNVDASKWSFERNCWGGGNGEAQCYVDAEKNVWLDGDNLHIKAIREDTRGPNMGDDEANYNANDLSGSGAYSSGRIRSKGKGDWRYGRFEIRAKLPAGQGTWPAIWMLPTDWVYGGWASSGEIDIMEAVNLKVGGENRVHGTLHFGDNHPNNVYSGEAYILPGQANPADDFHEYAIEWEAGEIRWYVDGDHFATQTQAGWYSSAALDTPEAPFNQRFHMILNLAVGGDWAGNTNDTGIDLTAFPQEMVIDYVRVYQCKHDTETGKGCATTDGEFVYNPGVTPPTAVDTGGSEQNFTLFDGVLTAPFEWFTWTADGDIAYAIVDAGGEHGLVGEISYNTSEGIGFYQSAATADFSAYTHIEFDLRVTQDSRSNKSGFQFRVDCKYPCTSGNVAIAYPNLNTWKRYSVAIPALVAAGLNASAVDTPFVLAPEAGNGMGVTVQVDNIVLAR